eukprot:CAMPEP_0184543916 /NCGR_PEP_ID=MMETSP0199_2-20130426/3265_1 /TAXON_ID=1112570 /ORGANISM="Thraustochytrium sp., Strain LLF1b" /LENGTH=1425 /DNA_ID=CAMNT_0026938013 /DNA_START=207 /DNA_END=4484 /DNA_ORIENTATION=+
MGSTRRQETSLSPSSKSETQRAFLAIANAGFEIACNLDQALVDTGESQIGELLERLLDAGEFSCDFEFGNFEVAKELAKIERSARRHPDKLFSWALGTTCDEVEDEEDIVFPPRTRRLLVQISIGQALHEGAELWPAAAKCYLSMLALPGALSYQMFRASLLRKMLDRLDASMDSEVEIGPILSGLSHLVQHSGVRARLVEADLIEPSIASLLKLGAHSSPTVQEEILQVAHVLVFPFPENEAEATEDAETHFEDMMLDTSKWSAKPSAAASSNASKRVLMRALLHIIKSAKSLDSLEWASNVLNDLVRVELQRKQLDFSTSILAMLQHLCFEVSERASDRNKSATNILLLLQRMGNSYAHQTLYRFCQFLSKLSFSKEQTQRAFATQIAGMVVSQCQLDEDMVQGLLDILLARASDKVYSVRAAAIKGLGQAVEAPALSQLYPKSDEDPRGLGTSASSPSTPTKELGTAPGAERTREMDWLVRGIVNSGLSILITAMSDGKVGVRNCAVKAMGQFLCAPAVAHARGFDKLISHDFAALCERSRDESAMVRSSALQTSAKFLAKRSDERVLRLWISAVLPLVYDSEQGVKEAARNAIKGSIFDEVVAWHQALLKAGPEQSIALAKSKVWRLLENLDIQESLCLQVAFFNLARKNDKGNIPLNVIPVTKALQAAVEWSDAPENRDLGESVESGAWMLLDMILGGQMPDQANAVELKSSKALITKHFDAMVVVSKWKAIFGKSSASDTSTTRNVGGLLKSRVLNVLMGVSEGIPAQEATQISAAILELVDALQLETEVIRKSLRLLVCLCKAKAPDEEQGVKMIQAWGESLKERCEEVLCDLQNVDDTSAMRAVYLVGELAILGLDPDDKSKAYIPISETLTTLTMGILAMGGQTSEAEASFVSLDLRAHAFITTGKLCLRDEQVAKHATRMLVRELDRCEESEVIRSNVIVILGDLCRRYTNMIDPFMGTICSCLSDPSSSVRRHALILLTGLRQEEYIKWRGGLFVRYLMCAVDPDEEVRNLATYALRDIFPEKDPNCYQGNFVEVLYALNRVSTSKYQVARQLEQDATGSPQNEEKLAKERMRYVERITGGSTEAETLRGTLYTVLLTHMSDTHRLEVTNKICRDVLGEILDGKMKLPQSNGEVQGKREPMDQLLVDCFAVLCSPHIKVKTTVNSRAGPAEDEDELVSGPSAVQAKLAEAKTKVLGKLERKNLTEHVIPLVISFYRMLQRVRSPHLKFASKYLRSLMKSFKEEMNLVLGADKVLAQEIEYDLAREQKEEDARMELEGRMAARSNKRKSLAAEKSGRKKRRKSGVTFQPTENDVASRSKAGVLKTPIPKSAKKHRTPRASLGAVVIPTPKLATSAQNSRKNAQSRARPSLIMKAATPATAIRDQRRWSVEPGQLENIDPNRYLSQNLADKLQDLE